MCGIIGYVGPRECKPLLLQGLERLEYRGYDSAGHRAARGRRARLRPRGRQPREPEGRARARTARLRRPASATRAGRRTARSPRRTRTRSPAATPSKLSIVLNGIVENYRELKASARAPTGHTFTLRDRRRDRHAPHRAPLRRRPRRGRPRARTSELEGHFAFVVIHHDHPGLLVGARHQCPLVVGVGDGEMFLASNAAAFLRETRTVQFIEDGEIVAITPEGATLLSVADGARSSTSAIELDWDDEGAEKARLRDVHAQGDLRAARGRRRDDRRPRPPRHARARGPRPDRARRSRTCAGSSSSPAAPRTTPASSAAT